MFWQYWENNGKGKFGLVTSSLVTLLCLKTKYDVRFVVCLNVQFTHYSDVIMSAMESQITSLTIVYSTVYSGANQRKHQSSASLAFVRGIHRCPYKGPATRKMSPFDDVIMKSRLVGEILLIESYVAAMLRSTPITVVVVNINACSSDHLFTHAYYPQI